MEIKGYFLSKGTRGGSPAPPETHLYDPPCPPPCATAKMLMDTKGQTLCVANNRRGIRGRLCSTKRCFCILQIVWSAFLHTRRVFVPKRKSKFLPFCIFNFKKREKKKKKKRLDSKFGRGGSFFIVALTIFWFRSKTRVHEDTADGGCTRPPDSTKTLLLLTPTGGGQIVGMHCETCSADTVGGVLRAEIHLATASLAAPAEPSL